MTLDPSIVTDLRKQHHITRLYLAVYHPAEMVRARVVGTPAQGAVSITVGTVTTYKTPFKHATVYFGSTAFGTCDVGVGQIKSFAAPTLVINSNNFQLSDGDYVTILEEIKPEALVCNTDNVATLENDTETYTDENSNYKPLARLGTPMVAFLDSATVTVNYWSDSIAVAPGATLSPTVAWTFPGGTPGSSTSPGTSTVPIAVSYNAYGQHYHSLRVTDSNGKVHTGYRPTFIFNRAGTPGVDAPFSKVAIDSMQESRDQGGWTVSITVRDTANQAYFPDRALVVLFAEDWYDGVKESLGGQRVWSENIVFVGYIHSGSVKANVGDQTVSFEAAGLGPYSNDLTGDAVDFERQATSTDWHVLVGQTPMLAAYHLLTEHCTFDHICDLHLDGLTYDAQWVDTTEGSLIAQLQEIANSVRGVVGTSAQGLWWISTNPNLQDIGDRSDDNVLLQQAGDLIGDVEITTEAQIKKTKQVDFSGVAWTGTEDTDWFSVATDLPYSNAQMQTIDNVRCDNNQADSNAICGHYLAQINNRFPETVFHWRGNWRVFDCFPFTNIQINLTTSENKRGIAWSNQKFYPTAVSYNYQNGALMVSTTCEMETVGLPGFAGDYPLIPPSPPQPTDPPPVYYPTDPTPPPVPTPGRGNEAVVWTDQGLARVTGAYDYVAIPGSPEPVWSSLNGTAPNNLTGDALKMGSFNYDPWSLSVDHFTAGYAMVGVAGAYELWRATNLPLVSWAKVFDNTMAEAVLGVAAGKAILLGYTSNSFAPSVHQSNTIAVLVADITSVGNGQVHFVWSVNNGATWNVNMTTYLEGPAYTTYRIFPSYTRDYTFFITNNESSNSCVPGYIPPPFSSNNCSTYRIQTLNGNITPWLSDANVDSGTYRISMPFVQPGGVSAYTVDNPIYGSNAYAPDGSSDALKRIDTSITYVNSSSPHFTYTGIGDATMTPGSVILFIHALDENNMCAVDPSYARYIWTSANRGATWTRRQPNAVTDFYRSAFITLIDHTILLLAGDNGTGAGNRARVYLSNDFGSSFTRIDNPAGGSLETLLSLTDNSLHGITVDYYKP